MSVACGSCGSVIDANDENYKIIDKFAVPKGVEAPAIPLGTRGKYHGTVWEVVGYMIRCDRSEMYQWREYLLFNPGKGYRWLMEFDGHWTYLVMMKNAPVESLMSSGRQVSHLGNHFSLFHTGKAKVRFAMGEFYWNVEVPGMVDVDDYICPPEIVSREASADEVVWSHGEYVSPEVIRQAFNIKEMPSQFGVSPCQPSTIGPTRDQVFKWYAIFAGLLLFGQIGHMVMADRLTVMQDRQIITSGIGKDFVTPTFKIPGGLANLELLLASNVSNNWMEVSGSLINEKTGEAYPMEHGVEYYSGYDGGEAWSEGNATDQKLFSMIPGGDYHFEYTATGAAPETTFTVAFNREVPMYFNFLFCFSLISLFPIFIGWRKHRFEVERWSTSDFSPYWSQEEDE